jgi:hypothetical protein
VRGPLLALFLITSCGAAARARVGPDADSEEPADAAVVRDAAHFDLASDHALPLDAAAEPLGKPSPDALPSPPVLLDGGGPLDLAAPGVDAGAPDAGFSSQIMVAVGNDGRHMTSLNGKIWMDDTRETTGNRDGPKNLLAVAYANHQVVAVGGGCDPVCAGRIVVFDGTTWEEMDATAARGRLTGIAYGNGAWVAVGSMPPVLRSTDGKNWNVAAKVAVPAGLRAVTYGTVGTQPMFVAVGDGYTRVTSLDGMSWTHLVPSNGTNEAFRAVAIGNGVVVAAGGRPDSATIDSGRLIRSVDGINWTDEIVRGPELPNVVHVDGKFYAFSGAGDNILQISADGKEWLMQVTNGAGSNVAVGHLGITRFFLSRISPSTVKISTDGYTWGATATGATSMPGDSIINAFVIAGPSL